MKNVLFLLLFLIIIEKSTARILKIKVEDPTNSSDVAHTNINCQNCRGAVNDSEGLITNVNDSSTYFCERIYVWSVEVPLGYDILLTFTWPNEDQSHNGSSTCQSCKPYIEIIYGYSTSESTFKIDKFYNFRQLVNLNVPSHKTDIRFFSGVPCNDSQKTDNTGLGISFKAVAYENHWGLYTFLSVLIPAAFIVLGVAYFCVLVKKKEEPHQGSLSLPIPIYVDMENSGSDFKKCKLKGKQNRGLRLRTHHSSRQEPPKEIRVISSLVDGDLSGSVTPHVDLIIPDSSNPVPVVLDESKKEFFQKRLPPKVNLLSRFPRTSASTPRYASFHDEPYDDDRLSKSDVVIFEKRKVSRGMRNKIFNFDVLPAKEETTTQTELETSVFLHSSSSSSCDGLANIHIRELPFVSPK